MSARSADSMDPPSSGLLATKPLRLAIRAPNWVGDLTMATPILAAACVNPRFADVRIFVRKHLASVLADGPVADHVVPLASEADEVRAYRETRPDAVMLLTNSFGAALRAWRARVPIRAGAALSGRRALLTHALVPATRDGRRAPTPTAHILRDVAGLLGILAPDLHPQLGVRVELVQEENTRLARLGVDLERGYVLCCPGAAFGAAKLWPPERFAAVLDALYLERGWRGVVTGGPGEETLVGAVAAASSRGAISLAREPRDLERLKALVKSARLLLVGDSGPRWYAAAFDVPTVSVMGPNFPELTATSLERARILRVEGLECAPCLERVCPLGHHRCMRDLSTDRVLAAALELVA